MEIYSNITEALEAFEKLAVRPELSDFDEKSQVLRAPPPFRVETEHSDDWWVDGRILRGGTITVILRDADDVVIKMRRITVEQ